MGRVFKARAPGAWFMLFASLSLATEPADDGYTYPPVVRGGVTARLSVRVADPAVGPEPDPVRLTLTVEGGPALEVTARLDDPTDAWRAERASSWALAEDRVTWCDSFALRQAKPGPMPLPAVKVRFRNGPAAPWEEAAWVDILKEPRLGPGPEPGEPYLTGRLRRDWLLPLILGAVLVLLGTVWLRWRRRLEAPPLPPGQWALRELERLERSGLPPASAAEIFFARLSDVVRRYLAERFQLPAPRRTTDELLTAHAGHLVPTQRELLREVLQRCDLAKFARADASAEQCRETTALAREFVQQTAPGTAVPPGSRPA
jgi:hypothetical protein